MKDNLRKILLVICIGIFAFSVFKLGSIYFEYDYEKDSSQTWIMYVFEHEDIIRGKIEILSKEDNALTIKWSGIANIYANAGYDADVPFECVFKVNL